jgi:hypothetical protein
MHENAPCRVAQDGGGVTGPANGCQREMNLKDHRTGRTKEALTGRRRLYNGLRGRSVADNGVYVGIRCQIARVSSTKRNFKKSNAFAYVSTVPMRADPGAAPRWQEAEVEVGGRQQLLLPQPQPCPFAARRARGV